MISSRFPRRALRHLLRGFRRLSSSSEAARDSASSFSRTINEISAKGLLALAVSWSVAEIALVFTMPTRPIAEHIAELPLAAPPIMEVANTSRQPLLSPAIFWLNAEP